MTHIHTYERNIDIGYWGEGWWCVGFITSPMFRNAIPCEEYLHMPHLEISGVV